MAHQAQALNVSSLTLHLESLRAHLSLWTEKKSRTSCFVCLLCSPSRALQCGHWLCNRCIRSTGTLSTFEPWKITLSRCPLCQALNQHDLVLRPPTAARRILHVDGPVHCKIIMGDFLKHLQTSLALNSMPLRDHFDVVRAKGVGSFFALGMFNSRWTIDRCNSQLQNMDRIQIKHSHFGRLGHLHFGEGITWPLQDVYSCHGADIRLDNKRSWSSPLFTSTRQRFVNFQNSLRPFSDTN